MTSDYFAPFETQRTVLLTTYKRDGTPIATPVHIAVVDDVAYVRTYDKAWKWKRVRNVPSVEITPSTARGRPTGDVVAAIGRIVDGEDACQATRALGTKYPMLHGRLIPFVHRLMGYRTIHIELRAPARSSSSRSRPG